MSLVQLGAAMQRNTDCTDEQLLSALVLCSRYCLGAGLKPTMHTMHRLYVTALFLVLKSTCDVYFKNATYATLSGLSLLELNRLEVEMVEKLQWRLLVTSADVVDMIVQRACYFAELALPMVPCIGRGFRRGDASYLAGVSCESVDETSSPHADAHNTSHSMDDDYLPSTVTVST